MSTCLIVASGIEYFGIYWEVYLVMFGGGRGGLAKRKFSRNLEEVIFTDKQNRITIYVFLFTFTVSSLQSLKFKCSFAIDRKFNNGCVI